MTTPPKEGEKGEKVTELQLRVRQLMDQVVQIQKEQNYQRFREERFRSTSELVTINFCTYICKL